jgi:hypothetical protein
MNEAMTMTGEEPQPSSELRDRWLFWPTVVIFFIVFNLVFLCGLPGEFSFILIPLVVLATPIVAVTLLVAAGVLAAKRRRRMAASVVLAVLFPILLATQIGWATDCLHLGLTVGFGTGQLGSTSIQKGDQFFVYDWSVGLAGGSNTFLIHDVTGEIALPPARHKYPIASENGFGEECAGRVRQLLGHYYVCTF